MDLTDIPDAVDTAAADRGHHRRGLIPQDRPPGLPFCHP